MNQMQIQTRPYEPMLRLAMEVAFGWLVPGGVLRVEDSGAYRFALTSDDGLHGAVTRTGVAPLAAGGHAIMLEYFNKTGGFALGVQMARGSAPFENIADGVLSHDETGDNP